MMLLTRQGHLLSWPSYQSLWKKWFTKQNVTVNDDETPQEPDQEDEDQWCYCRKGEDNGAMIGCDNDQCPIRWFHFSCLKMTPKSSPQG